MKVKNSLLVIVFVLGFSEVVLAQKIVLNGVVKDEKDETLVAAGITVKETGKKVLTDVKGEFKVELPSVGDYTLLVSSVGFKTLEVKEKVLKSKFVSIVLESDSYALKEIIVSETAKKNVKSTETGVNRLSMKTVEKIPALMGEIDLIRVIQMMPGVTTVGEGATGFNVRGGGIDHNLVLMDGVQIFNSSHILGFFSIFNPDAVHDATLTKGGIPAQYGGRLASVLDVKMKDGNSNRYTLNGGVGTIFSRLSFEGPISDKGSFIIAARRSYFDLFLKLSSVPAINSTEVNFTDLTLKGNYKLSKKDKLYISTYWGRDVLAPSFGNNKLTTKWGNKAVSVRLGHIFNEKIYSNLAATYSSYYFGFNVSATNATFDWVADMTNYNLKYDFNLTQDKHLLTWGLASGYYKFNPGNASVNQAGVLVDITVPSIQNLEQGVYFDDEYTVNEDLSFRAGLRVSSFQLLGPYDSYTYQENNGLKRLVTGLESKGSGTVVANYWNPEPRFSFRYSVSESSSIKGGYNRMAQYIHLISAGMAAAPFDNYMPTTKDIKPEIADQVSLGYFSNYHDDMFETSVEVYYKDMQNQIEYVPGARTFINKNIEGELLYGKGRAYGAEFFIRKAKGKLTGWSSYTLGKTERQVNYINNNDWFPAKYDRRHNFNITLMYEITKNLTVSADWVYLSGTRMTLPTTRYVYQDMIIGDDYYDTRNQFQLPAYHRLDFAATYEFDKQKNNRYTSNLVFSLYNVYERHNAYMIYTQPSEANTYNTEAVQLSIIGSIIPALTYNFKF